MTALVTYATRNGSTREVAAVIAGNLRALGVDVELGEARYVRGLTDQVRSQGRNWNLVVLGVPLYSGRWHRDAHRFLRQHRKELAGVPVAVFGMGPRDADLEAWQRSRKQLDRALAKHDWLTPIAVTVFGEPIRLASSRAVTCATGPRSKPGPPASSPPRPGYRRRPATEGGSTSSGP